MNWREVLSWADGHVCRLVPIDPDNARPTSLQGLHEGDLVQWRDPDGSMKNGHIVDIKYPGTFDIREMHATDISRNIPASAIMCLIEPTA
jgi:hypothetical protein